MTTENTNTPQKADCPSATCSASWFLNGAEYRKRNGYIEARNNLNPDWVVVDKDESSDSMPNTTESRREFEEWVETIGYSNAQFRDSDEYISDAVQVAWEAWQAARERQWMPIETAPKDRTEILTLHPQFGLLITRWLGSREMWQGWAVIPTYWMPLPNNPPTSEKI